MVKWLLGLQEQVSTSLGSFDSFRLPSVLFNAVVVGGFHSLMMSNDVYDCMV